ncbi:MAG: NYN domain-containing protein [Ignavibacteriae bacterium]|nr:NYN domain-containing protein [Ignavibacteriota bacterium]
MIKKYIIDGNNLIGKIPQIWNLQKKDKQASRVRLVSLLQLYFSKKNVNVSLHFDGFAADAIPSGKLKIKYSNNKIADIIIKEEIDLSKNPKVLAIVSSDHNIQDYARVNSCTVIKSEDFAKQLSQKKDTAAEEEINKSISNDEMKRLFGVE